MIFSLSEPLLSVDVTVDSSSITSDSLTISWTVMTVDQDLTVTQSQYTMTISYTNTDCPDDIYDDITGISQTMYTLTGLEEGIEYSITVTAILSDNGGSGSSDTVMATTISVG